MFGEFTTKVKCCAFFLSALKRSRAYLKMTVLQQISNPYLALLILRLLCTATCHPYIISYSAGIGAGFRKEVIITHLHNSGRAVVYAFIGTILGLLRIGRIALTIRGFGVLFGD